MTRTDFDHALAATPVARIRAVYLVKGRTMSPESERRLLQSLGPPLSAVASGSVDWLLAAHWEGPHSGGVTPEHTARLSVAPVPSLRRAEFRAAMTGHLLPSALRWLQRIEASSDTVLDGRHDGYGFVCDGESHFAQTRW